MASLLRELCTGERVVVALFLSRVLQSVPSQSISLEALALSLLALAALAIEISADRSPAALSSFRIRPGASSGILLGAVTLPSVILARSIQLSRYAAAKEEFAYLRMHYWAVSMSCVAVLVFVYFALFKFTSSSWPMLNIFLIVCLGLYLHLSYLSLTDGSSCGKMLWFVCLGVASVGLISHILRTFPSCASIGEALLVSTGLVAYFGDMMAHTLLKVNPVALFLPSEYAGSGNRSEISTIIQGFLSGLLLLPSVYKLLLRFLEFPRRSIKSESQLEGRKRGMGVLGQSVIFYAVFGVIVVIIAPAWMQFVNTFHIHPILWIFNFLYTDPIERLFLCTWWVSIICAAIFWFYNISKHSKIERILLRKYYHLLAVVMFSPALVIQPNFLDLAFGVALSAFLTIEMIRVWKIWPFGEIFDRFMNAFTDHRDSDILIISHFSLLLGCSLPKWLSYGFVDRPLAPFAGILSLGIGDTMASVVGHKYGTLRWSKTGKKTIEGTAAGITSVLVSCSILLSLLASTGYILSQHWFSLLSAVTLSGLLEAYTMQLDNAFIPLVFYSLLCL